MPGQLGHPLTPWWILQMFYFYFTVQYSSYLGHHSLGMIQILPYLTPTTGLQRKLYRENWESESLSNLPQLHHQQVSGQRSKLQILMLSNTSCTWETCFTVSYLFLCLSYFWMNISNYGSECHWSEQQQQKHLACYRLPSTEWLWTCVFKSLQQNGNLGLPASQLCTMADFSMAVFTFRRHS